MGMSLNCEKKTNRWRIIFTKGSRHIMKRDLGRNERVAKDQYKKLLLRYYYIEIMRCLDKLESATNKSEIMAKHDKKIEKMITAIAKAYKIQYTHRKLVKQE